jgi:hypothetical protein
MESELCTWAYTRHAYCVIYHGTDVNTYYYSPPEGVSGTEVNDKFVDAEPTPLPHPIQDDDNVQMLIYRIQTQTRTKAQCMYFYIEEEGTDDDVPSQNLAYDLTYKLNKKQVRRMDYDIVPDIEGDFKDTIQDDIDWTNKITKHDFTSSLLSSYQYPDDSLRVIHCVPIDRFIDGMENNQDAITTKQYHIKTYYPDVRLANVLEIRLSRAMITLSEEEYQDILEIVVTSNRALEIINERDDEILTMNSESDVPVQFGDGNGNGVCNILEAVIHVNHNENNDEFVDLKKIFFMVNTNSEMPFSRYFMDGEKSPKYKIYHDITNEESPLFMPRKTIQEWINPKLNKILDKTDIYAIQQEELKKIGNRGLAFRFVRPIRDEDEERKFFTLNIYRNGRMDIKCHWEEAYGAPDSPGGTPDLVRDAIQIVIDFVTHLNKLQYHIPAMGKKKLTVPRQLNDPDNNNTKVAFFNTITTFDFGSVIDRTHFMKYLEQYTNSHIVLVERDTISGLDVRSFEFRYKRLHNYIHIKSIHRMIKQYIDKIDPTKTEYKKDIIKFVAQTNALTELQSRKIVDDYEDIYGIEKSQQNRGRGRKSAVSGKQIAEVLGRSIDKKTGIDVKILKRDSRGQDGVYKCLILGIGQEMLGQIIHFLRQIVLYYKHHMELIDQDSIYNYADIQIKADIDREGEMADAIQVEQAEHNATSRSTKDDVIDLLVLGMSDAESDTDESDDESQDQTSEPLDQDQITQQTDDAPEAKKPEPPEPPKRNIVARSMLEILKSTLPNIYNNPQYSSKCQKTDARQPLVVAPETKIKMEEYVLRKKAELEDRLQDAEAMEEMDIRLHLRELDIHQQTLDNGALYNNKFFFCPLTWDYMSDSPNWEVQFPRLQEALEDNKYYHPRMQKWSGKDTVWNKNIGTATHDQALGKLSTTKTPNTPKHPWYLSFIKNLGDPKNQTCMACCFKTIQQKTLDQRKMCLSKGTSTAIGTSSGTQSYVLAEKSQMLDKDRFARIPSKLDRIFNRDDPNEEGLKLNAGSISPGFSFYLRKGVQKGNQFINALSEIVKKRHTAAGAGKNNLIQHLIEILDDSEGASGMDPLEIFKSMKQGSLYQLFMPTSSNPATEQQLAQMIEEGDNELVRLPLQRFIKYLVEREDEVDEDFLWDLISMPGIILPEGLNLIICDVKSVGRRSKRVETGTIKCPVGFEISTLYDVNRKTLVLYKYGSAYEIVCKVEANEKRNINVHRLFEPGHPLIEEIISFIKTQCHPIENNKARQELQKHIDNVSKDPDFLDQIFLADAEPIYLDNAIKRLSKANEDGIPGFAPSAQVIDSYNKVTHLLTDMTEDSARWVPVHPSGIALDQDLHIMTRADAAVYRSDITQLVHDCVMLAKFGNFVGYMPYAFLIDPGQDLDDPVDDIIIGLILENGLITFTEPMPVVDLDVSELEITHPNPQLGLEPVSFNIETLFFNNREEQWYSDYKDADQALEQIDNQESDWRRIYSIRSAFEQEVYQRLRYELTKLLPQIVLDEEYEDARATEVFTGIIMSVETGDVDMGKARGLLKKLVELVLEDHHTHEEPDGIVEAVGPTDRGFDNLLEADMNYPYTYIRPFVRYECHNETLAEYRREQGNHHCVVGEQGDKVYVPEINLVNGRPNNYENYIERIVEELLRIPLKRFEILNDEMDNFVADHYVQNDQEYYLDTRDDAEMFDEIKRMYDSGIDYRDKMKTHYDVANPAVYYAHDFETEGQDDLNVCHGSYINLPAFWIEKLRTQNWKIYQIEGPYDCFYKELDNIIFKRNRDHGISSGSIDTRNDIARMIDSDMFPMLEEREGWEVVRDVYAARYPKIYNPIKTRGQLLDFIRNSERHRISELDLSLISRKHNIRFIILSKPIKTKRTLSGEGFSCLGSTQTTAEGSLPITYIVLYYANLQDFHIVKDTSYPVAKGSFTAAELPDAILKRWIDICTSDVSDTLDIAAHLFYSRAPQRVRGKSGHIRYVTADGKRISNLTSISKSAIKKAGRPVEDDDADVSVVGLKIRKLPAKKHKSGFIPVAVPESDNDESPDEVEAELIRYEQLMGRMGAPAPAPLIRKVGPPRFKRPVAEPEPEPDPEDLPAEQPIRKLKPKLRSKSPTIGEALQAAAIETKKLRPKLKVASELRKKAKIRSITKSLPDEAQPDVMRRLKEQINAQPLAEDQPVRVKAKLPAPKLRKISIKPIAPKLPIAAPEDDSDSE